jgi:hypothetical protein
MSVTIDLPPEPSPEEVDAGLAPLRRLRRTYLVASLAFLPSVIGIGALTLVVFPASRALQTITGVVAALAYLRWLNRVERRLIAARCPRCGGAFHGPSPWGRGSGLPQHIYPRRCQQCGLRLNGSNVRDHDA